MFVRIGIIVIFYLGVSFRSYKEPFAAKTIPNIFHIFILNFTCLLKGHLNSNFHQIFIFYSNGHVLLFFGPFCC